MRNAKSFQLVGDDSAISQAFRYLKRDLYSVSVSVDWRENLWQVFAERLVEEVLRKRWTRPRILSLFGDKMMGLRSQSFRSRKPEIPRCDLCHGIPSGPLVCGRSCSAGRPLRRAREQHIATEGLCALPAGEYTKQSLEPVLLLR